MSINFLAQGGRRVTNVTTFLKENASGSSIKYSADRGAKHRIYVPYTDTVTVDPETGVSVTTKEVLAYSFKIHEWNTADGKYKACICTEGLEPNYTEDGQHLILGGTCPLCKRKGDAWEIYNYRKKMEQEHLIAQRLTGESYDSALKAATTTYISELKVREPKTYLYLLVAQFETKDVNGLGEPVIGADGLPAFALKVMKLSETRLNKIQEQINNSGAKLPGSELVFAYKDCDDVRRIVGESSVALQYDNKFIERYKQQGLLEKINSEVEKFDWNQLDKAFLELKMMSDDEGEKLMNESFQKWDEYKKELLVNPGAKYLEYASNIPVSNPGFNMKIGDPMYGAVQNPYQLGTQNNGMPVQNNGMPIQNSGMPMQNNGMNIQNDNGVNAQMLGGQNQAFGGNQQGFGGAVNQGFGFGQQNVNPQSGANPKDNVADPNAVFGTVLPKL